MPRPNKIRVDSYFKRAGTAAWSKYDAACSKTFTVATVDPTPTPKPGCICNTSNNCSTACFFDKFSKVNYASPIKCNLSGIFTTAPTAAQKTSWCRTYLKTKGDADSDGKANFLDYFYYVAARSSAKVPPTVNVDFDGNGLITTADRDIIIKSILGR